MRAMNEYQRRDLEKYEESTARLTLIVDELNKLADKGDLGEVTEFDMVPPPEDPDTIPARVIFIEALTPLGRIELMAERDGYHHRDRWEFIATGWPEYTDENGNTSTIDPSNLWNPKESRPSTTAAQDREPKAIAKQIASKIIGEYQRIFTRCWGRAEDAQAHADKTAGAVRRLADACQDEREFRGRPQRSFYVRNLSGDPLQVEFRSEGDVKMNLTTDEAIAVIDLIRKRRAK